MICSVHRNAASDLSLKISARAWATDVYRGDTDVDRIMNFVENKKQAIQEPQMRLS